MRTFGPRLRAPGHPDTEFRLGTLEFKLKLVPGFTFQPDTLKRELQHSLYRAVAFLHRTLLDTGTVNEQNGWHDHTGKRKRIEPPRFPQRRIARHAHDFPRRRTAVCRGCRRKAKARGAESEVRAHRPRRVGTRNPRDAWADPPGRSRGDLRHVSRRAPP